MKGPFGARLEVPGRRPVDVSEILTDFSFRRGIPGGYKGAQGKLWASIEDYKIRADSKLVITNGMNAETLWEGYLDSPGDSFDESGEAFELSAQGSSKLVGDQAEQLLYLDSSYENWRADDRNDEKLSDASQADVSAWPDTEQDALMVSFASGTPIKKGSEARIIHDLADTCPMGIGGYAFKVKCGLNAEKYEWRITSSVDGLLESRDLHTDSYFPAGVIGWVNFNNAFDVLKLRLRRTGGATNVGTDRIWAGFADPYVVGNRLDRHGLAQLSSGSLPNLTVVKAHEVVEDLIARMMPQVDPFRVHMQDTEYDIDQLTYAEEIRASGVLEDLGLFEPDFYWKVGPSGSDGKYAFSYIAWPTTPRYEISYTDGYSAPGSESPLCNRIAVGWVDRKGRKKQEIRTRYVGALGGDPADESFDGRIVDAEKIELDESVSSLANARRIGDEVLRLNNEAAKAATATVVRRIWDRRAGCTIPPWEIEPGFVARLRETGENFRLTEVEVDTEALSANLTLGTPQPTVEQLIARLSKPSSRRRKR